MRAQRWVIAAALGGLSALVGCQAILGNDYEYLPEGVGGGGGTMSVSSSSASGAGGGSSGSSSSSGSGAGGGSSCVDNSDCVDNNPCSIDTCDSATGACSYPAAPDGAPPGEADAPDDCIDVICKGGQKLTDPDDAEAPPDDMNPCTKQACAGGAPMTTFEPVNTSCGAGGLKCNDSGVCVGCIADADCPDVPECMIKKCTNSACSPGLVAKGNPCAAGSCDGSGACVECNSDMDCNAAAGEICDVATNTCMSSCGDMMKNGLETDVDCGGACPQNCADGKMCANGGDCQSQVCQGNVCQAPTCSDNKKNGAEDDVDCGSACPGKLCTNGKMCNANADCFSNLCAMNACIPCNTDGMKNGLESDVDCGIACGAGKACADGKACSVDPDCTSNYCDGVKCYAATCHNFMKDGSETDVDCGGVTCPKCAAGKTCTTASDCVSSSCSGNPKKCQ